MPEIWKIIPGFEEYSVSDYGRVKSNQRRIVRKDGKFSTVKEKIKELQILLHTGYVQVGLWKHNKMHQKYVHVLVMLAFAGPKNSLDVNHKNCVKTHNFLANLEYCTRSENLLHASANGRKHTPKCLAYYASLKGNQRARRKVS